MIALAAFSLAFVPAPQQAFLRPTEVRDFGEDELFGNSVVLEGDTAWIGAPGNGPGSVHGYTFDGTRWNEVVSLSGVVASGRFGFTLDLDGDTLAVGAPSGPFGSGGAVMVYRNVQGTWIEEANLAPQMPQVGAFFGYSVALEGDRLVVGAPSEDREATNAGAAYLFERSGSTWTQVVRFGSADYAPTSTSGLGLGVSIDLSGDRIAGAVGGNRVAVFRRNGAGVWNPQNLVFDPQLVFGFPSQYGHRLVLEDDELFASAAVGAGRVYAYEHNGVGWVEQQVLTPQVGGGFGERGLAFDGQNLLVGRREVAELLVRTAPGAAWQFDAEVRDDATNFRSFSDAIALDGNRALFGAPSADAYGPESGAAHFAQRASGASFEVGRTIAPSLGDASGYRFGAAIALDGDRAAVRADAPGLPVVYTWAREASGWVETQLLSAPEYQDLDGYGSALSLVGDSLLVGAPRHDPLGTFTNGGSVFAYRFDGQEWVSEAPLVASPDIEPNRTDGNGFGEAFAREGDWLVIGAPNQERPNTVRIGFVYTFSRPGPGAAYTFQQRIGASNNTPGMRFGAAIAMSGEWLAVGSPEADRVDLFERQAGVYVERQRIDLDDGFGAALALDGGTLVVASGDATTVRVFERSLQTFAEVQVLLTNESPVPPRFGRSLQLSGDTLVVSAAPDAMSAIDDGAAYVFRKVGGRFVESRRFAPNGAATSSGGFGSALALSGDTLAIGIERADSLDGDVDEGLVVLEELEPDVFTFCSCAGSAPCGNEAFESGCANSTGSGASIAASGSTSVTADDLVITVSGLPASVSALVFRGTQGSGRVPFGDGLRCVAGQTRRGSIRNTGPAGSLSIGPGYVASENASVPPALTIAAGQTWYFQGFYRDTAGPCGSASSLSNALAVLYRP